ncbi:hypothetical protein BU24DRAFT_422567 [Aaosphaeria arxii CBS 175.79]|uniref:Uncharacterized protein n=1 Tax=Aaosphaeria arxii CBS 175.79 TaxID=1450172 RepID=A0A6A5XSE0_9PLEO|nr:uncharacterized protein BU24DRAFT_422567 [Aaosphaeria arxii CBS 175.79]KAF2016218.1 hypothetical protein BU24DRAFT_422567 [Aaosphaeria arxii CBS 175.79]
MNMNSQYNNNTNTSAINDNMMDERQREMEVKEYQHATRNRRPSMLEEAEAFANANSPRTSTSGDSEFLTPEQANAQRSNRNSSRSPSRSAEPEIRRASGHFTAPMSHPKVVQQQGRSGKMESWKANMLGKLK